MGGYAHITYKNQHSRVQSFHFAKLARWKRVPEQQINFQIRGQFACQVERIYVPTIHHNSLSWPSPFHSSINKFKNWHTYREKSIFGTHAVDIKWSQWDPQSWAQHQEGSQVLVPDQTLEIIPSRMCSLNFSSPCIAFLFALITVTCHQEILATSFLRSTISLNLPPTWGAYSYLTSWTVWHRRHPNTKWACGGHLMA